MKANSRLTINWFMFVTSKKLTAIRKRSHMKIQKAIIHFYIIFFYKRRNIINKKEGYYKEHEGQEILNTKSRNRQHFYINIFTKEGGCQRKKFCIQQMRTILGERERSWKFKCIIGLLNETSKREK